MNITYIKKFKNHSFYQTKSEWLEKFGSPLLLDTLYTILLCPLSFFGCLLNLLSLAIFFKKQFFTKPIFNYLRVYMINSLLLSSYFIFDARNSYETYFYGTFFFIPVQPMFYSFNSLLDLYLSVERLSIFITKIKLNKLSWKITCFLMLAFCFLINTPHVFVFEPKIVKVKLSTGVIYSITIWVKTNFGQTLFGKIVLCIIYSIRDLATLGLELFLNVLLIVLIKRHFNKKKSSEFYIRIRKGFSRKNKNMIYMVAIISLLSTFQHLFFYCVHLFFDCIKAIV